MEDQREHNSWKAGQWQASTLKKDGKLEKISELIFEQLPDKSRRIQNNYEPPRFHFQNCYERRSSRGRRSGFRCPDFASADEFSIHSCAR
jgi:hypothetical protein